METLIFFSGILVTCVFTAVVCLFVHSPKKRALVLMSVYLILFIMLSILNFLASNAHAADHGYVEAGEFFGIDPTLIRAIAWVEAREQSGARSKPNRNGSVDLCHMQVNSRWHGRHGKAVIDWDYLARNATYCTYVGAWVLAGCLARYPESDGAYPARAVACYHMGADPAAFEARAGSEHGKLARMDLWRARRARWYARAVKDVYDWFLQHADREIFQ